MVRTAGAGIRVSAGKSSKKVGGGNNTPSSGASNKSKAGSSSSKLPPIPFQETPSWQKPITNFFKTDVSPLKAKENESKENKDNLNDENKEKCVIDNDAGPSKKLKLDSEYASGDNETSIEVQDSEKNESCEETAEADKENGSQSPSQCDEEASSSKN